MTAPEAERRPGGGRSKDDIALELMKFIAVTTGYGKVGGSSAGFSGKPTKNRRGRARGIAYSRCLSAAGKWLDKDRAEVEPCARPQGPACECRRARLLLFLAEDFFAAFFAGAFFAAFFAGAFLAAFLAGAFLAAFLAGAFLAAFFAGAFLAAFFAGAFFAAFLAGAFFAGAFLAGAFFAAFLAGAFLRRRLLRAPPSWPRSLLYRLLRRSLGSRSPAWAARR